MSLSSQVSRRPLYHRAREVESDTNIIIAYSAESEGVPWWPSRFSSARAKVIRLCAADSPTSVLIEEDVGNSNSWPRRLSTRALQATPVLAATTSRTQVIIVYYEKALKYNINTLCEV